MNQLSEEQLTDLYAWVDSIPLSRRKKNLPRDFSDAVLMAEVVNHFFPKLVDLYNYDQGLKIDTKVYNWKTLNNKVLKKLPYNLDNETINDLANAKQGTIEKVLWDVREVMQNKQEQDNRPFQEDISSPIDEEIEAAKICTDRKILDAKLDEVAQQEQYIQELEAKIAKLDELLQMRDDKISQLSRKGK